jgi:CDP-4-dehydro-6-deoxyglucose reductase
VLARLVSSHEIAPEVRHFVFEAADVPALDFTPGQFVSFTSDRDGKPVTRAYSIASPPEGNRFELCLNRVKEGLLSPWLFEMAAGDTLSMKGPLGYFTPRNPFRDSVLVATGTGIAPFRSFLLSEGVIQSPAAVTLLFGARYESGLLYRAQFEEMAAKRPGFRFLPTVTRPDPSWARRTGRVQAHLAEALQGRTDLDVYICGLRAMVEEVRNSLKQLGFDRKQLIVEKYD